MQLSLNPDESANLGRPLRKIQGRSPSGRIYRRLDLWSFSILFALVAAILSGYQYGSSQQAQQLPIIFRAINPGYLSNDFFVNSASGFGPLYYYGQVLALVAGYVPLHVAMAVIWLVTFVSVSVITVFAARDIIGSALGGMIAALLVALSAPFYLGSDATVFAHSLVPEFFAMPFALLALWRGIRGQAIYAAIVSIPGILIHPSFGLSAGVLALVAAAANTIWHWRVQRQFGSLRGLRLASGILILGLTSLLWVVPPILTGSSLFPATDDIARVDAEFLLPDHLIPSAWDAENWALAAGFAIAVGIALAEFFRGSTGSESKRRERSATGIATTSILLLIAAALFGGWVFIELIPTRIAVFAQVFHLVVVAAWLGWILVAGVVAQSFRSGRWKWAVLFVASAVSAPTLLVFTGVTFAASRLTGSATYRSKVFFAGVAVLIFDVMVLTKVWMGQPTIRDVVLVSLGLPVVLMVAFSDKLKPVALATLAAGLVFATTSLVLDGYDVIPKNIPFASAFLAKTQPILTLDQASRRLQISAEDRTLILAARNSTHADAVFLIPWDWHYWRLFANRAVVVDRGGFPFQDDAIEEWHQRFLNIYDEGAAYPYNVSEDGLLELQTRYGFHYAVVPLMASMSFPVTATSEHWKIVQVAETVP